MKRKGTYYEVNREGHMRKVPEEGAPGTRAALMLPVKHEGRVIGVVQVMSDRIEYSDEQLELVEGLVSQMAAAARNARLAEERNRAAEAEAAAKAVAAEREQVARVLAAVGDGIVLVDGAGAIRFWNRAAEVMTGLATDDVLGRPASEALSPWSAIAAGVPIAEGTAVGQPVTLPVDVNGRELWLSFLAVPEPGGRGLHVPRPDRRPAPRGGEERLHRHDLARAAHADDGRARRGVDAPAARHRADARTCSGSCSR